MSVEVGNCAATVNPSEALAKEDKVRKLYSIYFSRAGKSILSRYPPWETGGFFMLRQSQRKLKIYTKTGDQGETSLYGGKRVSKANLRVEVYGTVDELNSLIGVIVAQYQKSRPKADRSLDEKLKIELTNIQNDLFNIGADLASTSGCHPELVSGSKKMLNQVQHDKFNIDLQELEKRVVNLEKTIDRMSVELPKIKHFILPGGGEFGSMAHLARAVCRRAERRVVELSQKEKIDGNIIAYLNRLSDLLFVMARYANFKEKKKEIIWSR